MEFITVSVTGVSTASVLGSTAGTIPLMSSGEVPRYIRVAATAAACVRIGAVGLVAVTTDLQVQPGDAVILHVPSGVTRFAVIRVIADGVVQISPLENM